MASGGETRKATSAAADEAGAGGRHGSRPGMRDRIYGQQENTSSKSSEVGGKEGWHEAYGVVSESSGVGGEEGGRKSYIVAENLGGDLQGVRGEVESSQGIDTPGVDEFPWGDETPHSCHQGRGSDGGGQTGSGWGRKPPLHPRNWVERGNWQRQGEVGRARYDGAVAPTAGLGTGDSAGSTHRHRALNECGHQGLEVGGYPSHSSAHLRHIARDQGGHPDTSYPIASRMSA